MLGFSHIPQDEIVRRSYLHFLEKKIWPFPCNIDVDSWPIGSHTVYTKEGKLVGNIKSPKMFAALLLDNDINDLDEETQNIKGFFTKALPSDFMKSYQGSNVFDMRNIPLL